MPSEAGSQAPATIPSLSIIRPFGISCYDAHWLVQQQVLGEQDGTTCPRTHLVPARAIARDGTSNRPFPSSAGRAAAPFRASPDIGGAASPGRPASDMNKAGIRPAPRQPLDREGADDPAGSRLLERDPDVDSALAAPDNVEQTCGDREREVPVHVDLGIGPHPANVLVETGMDPDAPLRPRRLREVGRPAVLEKNTAVPRLTQLGVRKDDRYFLSISLERCDLNVRILVVISPPKVSHRRGKSPAAVHRDGARRRGS